MNIEQLLDAAKIINDLGGSVGQQMREAVDVGPTDADLNPNAVRMIIGAFDEIARDIDDEEWVEECTDFVKELQEWLDAPKCSECGERVTHPDKTVCEECEEDVAATATA